MPPLGDSGPVPSVPVREVPAAPPPEPPVFELPPAVVPVASEFEFGEAPAAEPFPYPAPAAYPVPVVYAPPAAEPESAFADVPVADRRRPGYRRRGANPLVILVWAGLGLVLLGGLIAGGILAGPVLLKKLKSAGGDDHNQAVTVPTDTKPSSPLKAVSTPFPRRVLVMNVSRYLYCNGLTAGKGVSSDHVTEVARRIAFDWRVPQDKDNNQLFVLSDTAPRDARPMLRPIIQDTYRQFCETSRPQDRVLIYFGGHAVERDGKAYLVPVDGDLDDPASLLPLDDFWAAVKDCKAQQKVVVFDVCRVNEDDDRVRPGSEPMTEGLEKALHAAPPGVQVVTTCSAGQNALEYRRPPDLGGGRDDKSDVSGSLFLSAVRNAADRAKLKGPSTAKPEDALPVGPWVEAAKARMAEVAGITGKPVPVPKLTGAEGAAVAFNADEPAAKRFDFPTPPKGVSPADVVKITRLIDLPPIKSNRSVEDEPIENAVPFAEAVMKDYQPGEMSFDELKKDPEKNKLRLAAIDALTTVRDLWKGTESVSGKSGLRDTFEGQTNDAAKKMILAEQQTPARIILDLEEQAKLLDGLMGELDNEKSKFWKATFVYAVAQVKARLAFMHEYDFALGKIRTDALPQLDPSKGQTGYQMVSTDKMSSKKDIKEIADAAKELFGKLAAEHKGTPWAVLAKRAQVIALGLKWEPYSPGGMLKE